MKKRELWVWGLLAAAAFSSGGCVIVSKGTGGNAGEAGNGGNAGSAGNGGAGGDTGGNTGIGGTPSSCDADPADDECTACVKDSCCAEIDACANDADCADTYNAYSECFWPAADAEPSGYSTGYCKAAVEADKNAAGALIDCYKSKCSADADAACGTEEQVTWEGFAAPFIEEFCGGCHFDGYEQTGLGPVDDNGDPKKVANYSCDTTWLDGWSQSPTQDHPNGGFGNPAWFSSMAYATVVADGPLIWCGVSSQLPGDCDPTKFPTPKRFPPTGTAPNGAHCWWMDDGTTCAQPDDKARAKLVSWLFDGYVCNEGCDTTCASP